MKTNKNEENVCVDSKSVVIRNAREKNESKINWRLHTNHDVHAVNCGKIEGQMRSKIFRKGSKWTIIYVNPWILHLNF